MFKVFANLDFYLRFMIQFIVISFSVRLFTLFLDLQTQAQSLKSQASDDPHITNWFLKKKLEIKDWFFSNEFAFPFSMAIFSITFVFSLAQPLILIFGFLFFFLKYCLDTHYLVKKSQLSLKSPQMGNLDIQSSHDPSIGKLYFKSMSNYLLLTVGLFFTVNSAFFSTNPEFRMISNVSIVFALISLVAIYLTYRHWDQIEKLQQKKDRKSFKNLDI